MRPDLLKLTHRDSLGWFLNDAGLIGEGVEVGSFAGQFASRILSTWQGTRLSMIDPWINLPSEEYPEKHDHVDYEDLYAQCQKLAQDDPRAVLIRKKSVEAAAEFKTASQDFIYLDGAHDYANVMKDLDAWWPKLRVGGLLAGHDFYLDASNFLEVEAAVLRWMREHNQVFTVTPCSSFWTIKG